MLFGFQEEISFQCVDRGVVHVAAFPATYGCQGGSTAFPEHPNGLVDMTGVPDRAGRVQAYHHVVVAFDRLQGMKQYFPGRGTVLGQGVGTKEPIVSGQFPDSIVLGRYYPIVTCLLNGVDGPLDQRLAGEEFEILAWNAFRAPSGRNDA